MSVATLQELLEAGVHFGHQVHRWNPKMKPYIWGERNGIYIIDLTKTSQKLDEAYNFMKTAASQGKKIVFVGTKKQAADIVEAEATRCGAHYINRRWLGGTLTNFETIRTRINKLRELEEMRDNGHFERLGKKEAAVLTRQLNKLDRMLGGVKDMRGMPDILFIVDQRREAIAIQEANKAKVQVVAIVDTNCSPESIGYVIPGNDDASRSIRLLTSKMADAILEGNSVREGRRAQLAAGGRSSSAPSVTVAEMTGEEASSEAEKEAVAAGNSASGNSEE
ncbi:MAG: 30S ribosomal protein S2 [Vampirovibrionales bacterium]|nr:30S ribosomal protein S2 [Vampirovibrionales bacterium]